MTTSVADEDRPRRTPPNTDHLVETAASAVAAAVVVWAVFHLLELNAPLGYTVCWFLTFIATFGAVVHQRHGVLALKDRLATVCIVAGAAVALLPLFSIAYFLAAKGMSVALANFPHFFVHDMKGVRPTDPLAKAGMKHAILGTFEQVALATVATVPIGILTATYLNEVGGKLSAIVRSVADAMTGLPTIIAGLFVYGAWVRPRHGDYSGFAAAVALAVVMLPTMVRTAEEVLRIVSNNLREAALALGAPEWRMVIRVVIPTARAGLVTAAILSVARAVGETAPVLLTAFGTPRTNVNPFHGEQANLPLQIWTLVRSQSATNIKEAWGAAFVLVAIVLTLFALARIVGAGGGERSRVRTRTRRLMTAR